MDNAVAGQEFRDGSRAWTLCAPRRRSRGPPPPRAWRRPAVWAAAFVAAAAGGVPVEYLLLWVLPAVTLRQALLRLRAAPERGVAPTRLPARR